MTCALIRRRVGFHEVQLWVNRPAATKMTELSIANVHLVASPVIEGARSAAGSRGSDFAAGYAAAKGRFGSIGVR
jgi:hypothetical protein